MFAIQSTHGWLTPAGTWTTDARLALRFAERWRAESQAEALRRVGVACSTEEVAL